MTRPMSDQERARRAAERRAAEAAVTELQAGATWPLEQALKLLPPHAEWDDYMPPRRRRRKV